MQILERQKVEELLATLDFNRRRGHRRLHAGGGLYGYEHAASDVSRRRQPHASTLRRVQRGRAADDPDRKPGRTSISAGRAIDAISNAERARAEAAAKEEVRNAVIAILRGPAERRSRAADLRNDCSLSSIRRPPAQLLHRRDNTMVRNTFRRLVPLATAALLVALESTASAQYFGRNKVQYKKLDFQVLKTEHFDIYFYPSEREGIDIAARMAERWLARLEKLLGHQLRGRQPLVLYASHPDFEQTNAIQGELGEGTGGVTEPLRRRIVLPLGGPLADTDHVIGHELVHAFQFDITTRPNMAPGQTGAERLPLWFIEGMAEYLSIGPVDPNTAMWLRDAARRAGRQAARRSTISTTPSTSPIAGARRSGRMSAASGATT